MSDKIEVSKTGLERAIGVCRISAAKSVGCDPFSYEDGKVRYSGYQVAKAISEEDIVRRHLGIGDYNTFINYYTYYEAGEELFIGCLHELVKEFKD